MMTQLVGLLVAAILVEAAINAIFSIKPLKEFDAKITWFPILKIFSIILGIALCYKVNLDVLSIIYSTDASIFGIVLSGLFISRGSNYTNKFIKRILGAKTQIT